MANPYIVNFTVHSLSVFNSMPLLLLSSSYVYFGSKFAVLLASFLTGSLFFHVFKKDLDAELVRIIRSMIIENSDSFLC